MSAKKIKDGLKPVKDGWCVYARVRVNGEIIQKRQTINGTKEEAKALRESLKEQLRTGTIINCSLTNSPKIFKDILNRHLKKLQDEGRLSQYHEQKINYLNGILGTIDLPHIAERFEYFIAQYRVKGKSYQANRMIEIARAAFNTCLELKVIQENPITKERFPKCKQIPRDNYLQPEEVKKVLLTAAKNRRTCHIARALQYLFQVPCRRSEVASMRIADVDIFRQRIRVHNGTTKNDKGIWKPIPPNMARWFKCRLRKSGSLDEPVFGRHVEAQKEFVALGDWKHAWDTVRTDAGFPGLRIHDTRHISATDMVNNGTPRTVVNAVAGWSTDMLKSYYHLDADAALNHIQWSGNAKRETPVKSLNAEAV